MAVDTDLRTFILADATVAGLIGSRCYQNTVPSIKTTLPWLWFRRSRTEPLEVLGDDEQDHVVMYDVECVSDDLSQAIELRDAVVSRLRNHQGAMGSATYNWVATDDRWDGYVARNLEADEHLQIASIGVEVML
jgi:hypothetical protein